jgi:hypothetical protein
MPSENMIRAYIAVTENHIVEDDRLIMQLQIVADGAKQSTRQRLVSKATLVGFNELQRPHRPS